MNVTSISRLVTFGVAAAAVTAEIGVARFTEDSDGKLHVKSR